MYLNLQYHPAIAQQCAPLGENLSEGVGGRGSQIKGAQMKAQIPREAKRWRAETHRIQAHGVSAADFSQPKTCVPATTGNSRAV